MSSILDLAALVDDNSNDSKSTLNANAPAFNPSASKGVPPPELAGVPLVLSWTGEPAPPTPPTAVGPLKTPKPPRPKCSTA